MEKSMPAKSPKGHLGGSAFGGKKVLFVLVPTALLLFAFQASAHAVVSPDQVDVAQFVNFSLGVPSEKPMATTEVRLVVPGGLGEVTPYVKQGWKITLKKDSNSNITEIDWAGGSIPAGEKDQFLFSTQVPAQATTLDWKAYQTYQDGSVVSWDHDPSTLANPGDDSALVGPYSTTDVVNDLAAQSQAVPTAGNSNKANAALAISIAALALAVLTMALNQKDRP